MVRCMGLHVHLAMFADRVSDEVWQTIYEKARRVAKQWRPRPMAVAWRHIGKVPIVQYTLEIETPAGLRFDGDAETLTGAETFFFPARLERRGQRQGSTSSASPTRTGRQADVLSVIAGPRGDDLERAVGLCTLFGPKTQCFPYHVLLVALGLLVESSLPATAVVYGDISLRDGEQARRGLASILGEEFESPVALSAERIQQRLMGRMTARALNQALRALSPPDPHREAVDAELLCRLRSCSRVDYELERIVRTCRDPNQLDPRTQRLLCTFLDAVRSNIARAELRRQIEALGVAKAREALAHVTMKRGLRLTSATWDAIETADIDELAFLHGVLSAYSSTWDIHHAVRAVLENPVLRRL